MKNKKANPLEVPEFASYEEEAAFWDSLDTAAFMEADGEWFRFEISSERTTHSKMRRQPGSAKGLIQMSDDFDDSLSDFTDYMP